MNIAIVTINQENAAIASWLAAQDFSGCTLAHWQIEPQPVVAEQVLDALVEQWQRTPADVVLFPPGTFGDELSTRLAWRLHGASICQVTSLDIPTVSVRKSHWGNALTATLQTEKRPLCLSLARQAGAAKNATLPSGMQQLNIVPGALPDWLVSTEDLKNVTRDPLAEARRVLVVGQGGEADNQEIAMLAEKLGAEVGYSRARVMNGGVDAEKVIGISGHLLAPEVCIVVGASGAAALMAGAYVGLGIILIFTLGNLLDPSVRPLVMGATFGIALTLVIIAGSELFTGHTMFLTFGVKAGSISHGQMWAILPQTWLGNLVGSVFVAMLYSWGGGSLLPVDTSIVHSVALAKTTAPAMVLFFKGALCNWLVCLAIWMALRTEGAAKFIAIWWCLLAFIASGYEHSIANMTLFALSWFGNHSEAYTLAGIGHNLLWVTLGNTLSGAVFMGLGYWYATPKANRPVADKFNQTETAAG